MLLEAQAESLLNYCRIRVMCLCHNPRFHVTPGFGLTAPFISKPVRHFLTREHRAVLKTICIAADIESFVCFREVLPTSGRLIGIPVQCPIQQMGKELEQFKVFEEEFQGASFSVARRAVP